MWIALWAAVIVGVAVLYYREGRKGRGISYDTYRSKGAADDQARMNLETRGPNSFGIGGGP